jgi:glycosyltransferase involved in cell wall biosynthesis
VKVLVAHNRYRSDVPSGENRVVDTEMADLTAAGVEVVRYLRSSDEIATMSTASKIAVPLMPVRSSRAITEIESLIDRHRPDLLHLHNPYPLISLSVVAAAHRRGVPVVQTVHNHRHSCMRGSYFRDGHPCQECRGKALPWPAVQHGCYRDSRAQSVPMAVAFLAHRRDQGSIDRYIALTQPIADSLVDSGWVDPRRVVVRANSVPDPGPMPPPGEGLLFVGRLSQEKGVPLLLEAWREAERPFGTLTFVGDGPERPRVQAAAADPASGILLIGPTDPAGVSAALRASAALVLPSTSPEGLPLVVLEAFAHGRPVLVTDGGGLAAAVDQSVGWLARPDAAALAEQLRLAAHDDLMKKGRAARARYEASYSPAVTVAAQLEIYRSVIAERSE